MMAVNILNLLSGFGGEKAFQDLQERDQQKNQYCKKNNIPLIRVNKDYRHLRYEDLQIINK